MFAFSSTYNLKMLLVSCTKGSFLDKSLRCFSKSYIHNTLDISLSSCEVTVDVLEELDSGIVVISLNRPSACNALGSSITSKLMNTFEKLQQDQNARVVILRSLVPGVFSAGADLKERLKLSNSEVAAMVAKLNSLVTAIESVPIPTIAAIDGVALGGGLEITLGCDIRTVSDNAKLGLVETKWAIMPAAGGSQRLPRLINPAVAKELIFCAKTINGNEAKLLGLANHVVKQNMSCNSAYLESLKLARQILANGPLGVKMAKLAINQGLQTDIITGCKIEKLCYAQVIPTKDRIEGLLAFKENRMPKYNGE